MGTVTATMNVAQNGNSFPVHLYKGLTVKEAMQLGQHFINQALSTVMGMMQDPSTVPVGVNQLVFNWVVSDDSNGAVLGTQTNTWHDLPDVTVSALLGVFDGAMSRVPSNLKAKHETKK